MDVNVNNLININNLRKNELYGRVYHGGMTSQIGYVKFQSVIWYDITRIIYIQLMNSSIVDQLHSVIIQSIKVMI